MNGSNGIVPTVDLATNNTYPYPVMYGNGFGNSGFFGGDGIWALVLLALLFGGNNGFGFGNNWNGNNIATTDYITIRGSLLGIIVSRDVCRTARTSKLQLFELWRVLDVRQAVCCSKSTCISRVNNH